VKVISRNAAHAAVDPCRCCDRGRCAREFCALELPAKPKAADIVVVVELIESPILCRIIGPRATAVSIAASEDHFFKAGIPRILEELVSFTI
jgi:hypothetical protein